MYLNLIFGVVFLCVDMLLVVCSALGNPDGRSAATGGVSSCFRGGHALMNNQAGITDVVAVTALVSVENRFLLRETVGTMVGFCLPVKSNVFGLSFRQFGFSDFRQYQVGLACARDFGDRLRAGMQLDYVGISTTGVYRRTGGITFEAGLQMVLSDDLTLGCHVFNPLGTDVLGLEGGTPDTRIRLGMIYRFNKQLSSYLEIQKHIQYVPSLHTGIEYILGKTACVRIGYSSRQLNVQQELQPVASTVTFGFGLLVGKLQVDLASQVNTQLGWSPTASIIFLIGRNHERD